MWIFDRSLFRNIRFYVICFSILLSLVLYVAASVGRSNVSVTRLIQYYALTSVCFLYITLLIGPLSKVLLQFPLRSRWLKARRALGVSAFYFAFLHAVIAFFIQLGGFEGLTFLNERYVLAITLSFTALIILTLMAATSFDAAVAKLTFPRWKRLHQLVYLAAILAMIHALMLGSHFRTISDTIPQLLLGAILLLLFLHAILVGKRINMRFVSFPRIVLPAVVVVCTTIYVFLATFYPQTVSFSLSLHTKHESSTAMSNHNMDQAWQDFDPNRFSVLLKSEESYQANIPTSITMSFVDNTDESALVLLETLYEKPVHLIIVDSTLSYYAHIHPEPLLQDYTVTTTFPKEGVYYGFVNYQPLGMGEFLSKLQFNVGDNLPAPKSTHMPDTNFTKRVSNYDVTLVTTGTLSADAISRREQPITFSIANTTNTPVTTLKPYLGAFGHLVLVHQETYEYVHVHPLEIVTSQKPTSGPVVSFIPLSLTGPMKSGIYRAFLQLNPDDNLILVDYTIRID